jgi:HEPN domain-containing protein
LNKKIQYWIDIAEYDMITAVAMFEAKRYLYVGFMCHQIIEKLLKAYYVKSQNQTPPYTHNLRTLAETSGLSNDMDEETFLFIIGLQPLNIEARYPSYKDALMNYPEASFGVSLKVLLIYFSYEASFEEFT